MRHCLYWLLILKPKKGIALVADYIRPITVENIL
jgi:hypothetical protein